MSLHQRRLTLSLGALGKVCPADWGRWWFPPVQHWWGDTSSTVSGSELPGARETWSYGRESSEGPQRWWTDWITSPARRSWSSWNCWAYRREDPGGIFSIAVTATGSKSKPRAGQGELREYNWARPTSPGAWKSCAKFKVCHLERQCWITGTQIREAGSD